MAEANDQQAGTIAPEIPSRNLPPVSYRDLPEPVPLRRIVGMSVILLAAALGSGEYVLWPYITSQIGLVFMYAGVLGILTQYFINMEIERYTLATGETAVTGFTRLWKPWWAIFAILIAVQNFWPGWATGGATTLTFALGGGNVTTIALLGLLAIGIALTASPVVYQTVEKTQSVFVTIIVVFIIVATVFATTGRAWGDLAIGFSNFGQIPTGLPISLLLTAMVFAGAGLNNLVQSNYVRDKGMGMGRYLPRIASPITGEDEARPSLGYFFRQDEENRRRWEGWWRIANVEQFVTFFVVGALTMIVLCVLAYSTVPVGEPQEQSLEFIRIEGNTLKEVVAPWFGTFFWLAGTVILFSTNLGVLDFTGRIVSDAVKTNWLRESESWSESRIYFAIVWIMIVSASVILLLGLEEPLILLVISGSLGGLTLFTFSILLIKLNRGVLPGVIKMRGFRLAAMVWAVLLYGGFSAVNIFVQAQNLFGG